MTDVAASPLRVGLIGLGRPGLHLVERFASGGPFRVVAVWAESIVAEVVSPFGVRLVNHPRELLAAADVDVVWFAESEAFKNEFAAADVLCGKHSIVSTPLALSSAIADRAFREAARCNRLLLVHHPRRSDPDYQQALAVTQELPPSTLRAVKFVSWSYGLLPRGATRGHGPLPSDASGDAQITKVRFVAHALDQLLPLVSDRPLRVFATGDQDSPGFPKLFAGHSLLLQMTFEQGCHAEIDIRLDSPTKFQSGWLLATERSGYAKGQKFTLTDDGEVFDSPVIAVSDGNEDADQFEWLAQQIRSGVRDNVEEARVRTVVAILDAAQRSLESRRAVEL